MIMSRDVFFVDVGCWDCPCSCIIVGSDVDHECNYVFSLVEGKCGSLDVVYSIFE